MACATSQISSWGNACSVPVFSVVVAFTNLLLTVRSSPTVKVRNSKHRLERRPCAPSTARLPHISAEFSGGGVMRACHSDKRRRLHEGKRGHTDSDTARFHSRGGPGAASAALRRSGRRSLRPASGSHESRRTKRTGSQPSTWKRWMPSTQTANRITRARVRAASAFLAEAFGKPSQAVRARHRAPADHLREPVHPFRGGHAGRARGRTIRARPGGVGSGQGAPRGADAEATG